MDKQELRNSLSRIEDDLGKMRRSASIHDPREAELLTLVRRLTQIVREEIVK